MKDSLHVIVRDTLHYIDIAKSNIPQEVIWGLTKTDLLTIGSSILIFLAGIFVTIYSSGIREYRRIKRIKNHIVNWLSIIVKELYNQGHDYHNFADLLRNFDGHYLGELTQREFPFHEITELSALDKSEALIFFKIFNKTANVEKLYLMNSVFVGVKNTLKLEGEKREAINKRYDELKLKIDENITKLKGFNSNATDKDLYNKIQKILDDDFPLIKHYRFEDIFKGLQKLKELGKDKQEGRWEEHPLHILESLINNTNDDAVNFSNLNGLNSMYYSEYGDELKIGAEKLKAVMTYYKRSKVKLWFFYDILLFFNPKTYTINNEKVFQRDKKMIEKRSQKI